MAASAVTPVLVLAGFAPGIGGDDANIARVRASEGPASGAGLFRSDDIAFRSTCTCCPLAGDLVRALRELHAQRAAGRGPAFTRVAIETGARADLRPILAALAELPLVAARLAPGAIVVAADEASLSSGEACAQLAMADRIVWRGDPMQSAAQALHALNPAARIDVCTGLPSDWWDTGLYRGDPPRLDGRDWSRGDASRAPGAASGASASEIRAFAWRRAEPFGERDLESRLEALVRGLGARLLRMKGLVAVEGERGPRAVHAAGHTLYPSARLPAWPHTGRTSRIAFSGRGLEERAIASILD